MLLEHLSVPATECEFQHVHKNGGYLREHHACCRKCQHTVRAPKKASADTFQESAERKGGLLKTKKSRSLTWASPVQGLKLRMLVLQLFLLMTLVDEGWTWIVDSFCGLEAFFGVLARFLFNSICNFFAGLTFRAGSPIGFDISVWWLFLCLARDSNSAWD